MDQGSILAIKTPANTILTENWYHVVVTYDPATSGYLYIYVNNVQYALSDPHPLPLNDFHAITDLLIGTMDNILTTSATDGEGCYAGLMDEFRI
jgi:hypothetical protein